jgi:hypothetical protein
LLDGDTQRQARLKQYSICERPLFRLQTKLLALHLIDSEDTMLTLCFVLDGKMGRLGHVEVSTKIKFAVTLKGSFFDLQTG